MFERFTHQARVVVTHASDEAHDLGHDYMGTEHLLLAMLAPDSGMAGDVLRGAGLDYAEARAAVVRMLGLNPSAGAPLGEEDAEALRSIGIDLRAVLERMERVFGPAATPTSPLPRPRRGRRYRWGPPFTRRAKKVLELSLREAVALGDSFLGTEHILLGLLREGKGLAAQVLLDRGMDLADLRRATLTARDRAA